MRQTSEMKKVWRFYTIAEYEQEEQWINEMAKEGWNLTAVGLCRYIFRRGTPGEYIYKLDIVERTASDEVRESYFNFLTECNIRVVGELKDWLFLQKKAAEGPFDMKDDIYAKLRHINKIYSFTMRTFCRLLTIFALIALFCIVGLLIADNPSVDDFIRGILLGSSPTALIMLAVIWGRIINKLRRQVNKLIDDIGVIV
ncbi:MAG: DUF2812 domain-containing protein [Alistipes sp.]|nr:DUF2812 domain-containing protein [Alistipes sp.]MBQ5878999.1 DUF2812 domain-containing protein [Alistipes sp.]MBR0331222.1 DUF2812 domain-containing protein [Alistipes sp.]